MDKFAVLIMAAAIGGGVVLLSKKSEASREDLGNSAAAISVAPISAGTSMLGGSTGPVSLTIAGPDYDPKTVLVSQRIAYYRAAYGLAYSDASKLAQADKDDPAGARATATAHAILGGAVGTGSNSLVYTDKSGGPSGGGEAWKLLGKLNEYDDPIKLTGGVEGAQGAAVITIIPTSHAESAGLWS